MGSPSVPMLGLTPTPPSQSWTAQQGTLSWGHRSTLLLPGELPATPCTRTLLCLLPPGDKIQWEASPGMPESLLRGFSIAGIAAGKASYVLCVAQTCRGRERSGMRGAGCAARPRRWTSLQRSPPRSPEHPCAAVNWIFSSRWIYIRLPLRIYTLPPLWPQRGGGSVSPSRAGLGGLTREEPLPRCPRLCATPGHRSPPVRAQKRFLLRQKGPPTSCQRRSCHKRGEFSKPRPRAEGEAPGRARGMLGGARAGRARSGGFPSLSPAPRRSRPSTTGRFLPLSARRGGSAAPALARPAQPRRPPGPGPAIAEPPPGGGRHRVRRRRRGAGAAPALPPPGPASRPPPAPPPSPPGPRRGFPGARSHPWPEAPPIGTAYRYRLEAPWRELGGPELIGKRG